MTMGPAIILVLLHDSDETLHECTDDRLRRHRLTATIPRELNA